MPNRKHKNSESERLRQRVRSRQNKIIRIENEIKKGTHSPAHVRKLNKRLEKLKNF